jgi:hypothetical protein
MKRGMVDPNDNPLRRRTHMSNVNTGWAIGAVVVVLLVGLSYFYNGSGTHLKPGPANAVTQQK